MALTGKQRAFVRYYIAADMTNAAEAYRKAYPAARKWTAASCANIAEKLLRHADILPIITKAREEAGRAIEQTIDKYALSKKDLMDQLARMITLDPRRVFKWGPDGVVVHESDDLTDDEAMAVTEVSQTKTAEGGTIRVKIADRQAAIMNFAKLAGHGNDKPETNIKITLEQLVLASFRVEP
jgi:hypothetical protein